MLRKLNTRLIVDSLIASVVVQQLPGLANKLLFSKNPLSGLTLKAVGAGGALLVGNMMRKPAVGSIGVALAVADIANDLVSGALGVSTETAPNTMPLIKPTKYQSVPALTMDDYLYLNDYIGVDQLTSVSNYDNYNRIYN